MLVESCSSVESALPASCRQAAKADRTRVLAFDAAELADPRAFAPLRAHHHAHRARRGRRRGRIVRRGRDDRADTRASFARRLRGSARSPRRHSVAKSSDHVLCVSASLWFDSLSRSASPRRVHRSPPRHSVTEGFQIVFSVSPRLCGLIRSVARRLRGSAPITTETQRHEGSSDRVLCVPRLCGLIRSVARRLRGGCTNHHKATASRRVFRSRSLCLRDSVV